MLRLFIVICCISTLITPFLSVQAKQADDYFWISYRAFGRYTRTYVMFTQINQHGEISVQPIRVLLPPDAHLVSTTFLDSKNRFHVFAANGEYRKLIIDRNDLVPPAAKPLGIRDLRISRFFWHELYATERRQQNFLAASVPIRVSDLCTDSEKLLGYRISDKYGNLLPGSFNINPTFPGTTCIQSAGLASKDGLAFFWGVNEAGESVYYFQQISSNGDLKGKPIQIDNFVPSAAQLTNVQADNMRLIAYAQDNRGGGGDDYADEIYVRRIHLQSKKLGPRFQVNGKNQFIFGSKSIAIDPKGRFVIFTVAEEHEDGDCALFYRALNPQTGRPLGKLKKLLSHVCNPINMVNDHGNSEH